jgi:quinohemoprotein ethanol dehydrogenase
LPEFPKKKLNPKLSGVTYQIESEADVMLGAKHFLNYCMACHGYPAAGQGGRIPNLGYSPTEVIQNLGAYVLNRALASKGMPDFTGRLTESDVEKIKAFIQITADTSPQ